MRHSVTVRCVYLCPCKGSVCSVPNWHSFFCEFNEYTHKIVIKLKPIECCNYPLLIMCIVAMHTLIGTYASEFIAYIYIYIYIL
jgi:hypothetical protein